MITLYQYGNSVCAQKVRLTLVEKGQSWETRRGRVGELRAQYLGGL